jgi:dihydrofolate reductase
MGKVIYSMNVSLDGFIETPAHSLDWVVMDEELHTWFNDEARNAAAFLYGRRLYEVMTAYWPTAESDPAATRPCSNSPASGTPSRRSSSQRP